MINKNIEILEFNKVKEILRDIALTQKAKEKICELKPTVTEREVLSSLEDTSEARILLDNVGLPPLTSVNEIDDILEVAEKGGMLLPEQFESIMRFVSSCRRLKNYLKKCEATEIKLAFYGNSIDSLETLFEEINKSIRNNMVDSNASRELANIRRKKENVSFRIKEKLDDILKSKKQYFSDGFVSNRNGHFTLPVKKEYKNQISGSVIDTSSSGATYFIEPTSVIKLKDEFNLLEIAQSNEENRILYVLTALIDNFKSEIKINKDAIETLDFIFAKGKLSSEMKAVRPEINTESYIKIKKGRHPLLNQSQCVPLDFEIGNGVNGVIITGPNTGGKTVALKTVGLFVMMTQCGLHIPCEEAQICMRSNILCDIGDGQSISQNLSTFSAHISNIIEILSHTNDESLVLLDELGSGTDPLEGMGIAISILEELRQRKCLFVATTHYPEVKEYAKNTDTLVNARMTFDRETLQPQYMLEIGEAGESCAIYIAMRLGMSKSMLECATNYAYSYKSKENKQYIYKDIIASSPDKLKLTEQEKIVKLKEVKNIDNRALSFNLGDSVIVSPEEKLGIVCQTANSKGEIGVMIQKEKKLINHKRLQIKNKASELYPEDYDFSVIFDTVENRKLRTKMKKGYTNIEIKLDDKL